MMNVPSAPPDFWPVVPKRSPALPGVRHGSLTFRDFTGMTDEQLRAQCRKRVLFFLRGRWLSATIRTARLKKQIGKIEFELMHIEGHYKLTTKYTTNLKRLGRYE